MTSQLDSIRAAMRANYLPVETEVLTQLVAQAGLSADERQRISTRAATEFAVASSLRRGWLASSDSKAITCVLGIRQANPTA